MSDYAEAAIREYIEFFLTANVATRGLATWSRLNSPRGIGNQPAPHKSGLSDIGRTFHSVIVAKRHQCYSSGRLCTRRLGSVCQSAGHVKSETGTKLAKYCSTSQRNNRLLRSANPKKLDQWTRQLC